MKVTTKIRIAETLRPSDRFVRSAHLERDFQDPKGLSSYVVTDLARSSLARLSEGLRSTSGQRAWRITGDYGSGKSSFALLLAHWFAGHDRALPSSLGDIRANVRKERHFVPALVTCSKQPLTISILQALKGALSNDTRIKNNTKLLREIEGLLARPELASENVVVDQILKVNTAICDTSRRGLLLIIDELGKFLEFAASSGDTHDVFLLQQIAEVASRSGKQPLFIVCLLHQGFGEYANNLSQLAQHEWEKVAGRFEQIIFDQPLEEIAELVASALDVRRELIPKVRVHQLETALKLAIENNWFGSANSKKLKQVAPGLFPLHPMLLPVLVRVFRRFGQNERSLFSFLFSNEPFGLQAFCENTLDNCRPYSLQVFYDYVRTNFGHRLSLQSY